MLDEGPNIPMSEYKFYTCPLDTNIQLVHEAYYENYLHYGEQDIVTVEEIEHLIKNSFYEEGKYMG
jgi:hypothetical protein